MNSRAAENNAENSEKKSIAGDGNNSFNFPKQVRTISYLFVFSHRDAFCCSLFGDHRQEFREVSYYGGP